MQATTDQTWTSRRRVEAVLNHQEPDRVPFGVGGTTLTGIHHVAYQRWRRRLGLPDLELEIEDTIQQLARVHQDVKDRLGVDVYGLSPARPRGISQPPRREDGYDKLTDEWGIEWWKPVEGGFYYDMRRHPLATVDTLDGLAAHAFPDLVDPARYVGLAERADDLLNRRQVASVLGRNAAGIWEMALRLRGFENFFTDMLTNVKFAEALLDRILEVKLAYWARALERVGPNVMIVSEADDLASQDRCLCRPELYRQLIKPRHTQLFAFIRKHAQAPVKIFFHSCGAVAALIPDLIESGIDILNPVQVSARGMDTRELKRQFGRDLTFYGGGVDTQRGVPRGTPQEVRDEVKRRLDDLAPGGGFIFATVHNIQADVPPENLLAMWEAFRTHGVY